MIPLELARLWETMRRLRYREQGFSLSEVLVIIAILGIVLSIATFSWFGYVESRRMDSATNQLAADLRLANSRATNQFANWQVVTPSSQNPIRNYELRNLSSYNASMSCASQPQTQCVPLSLPEGTQLSTDISVTFKPSGRAETSSSTVTVRSTNDSSKCRNLNINTSTSNIEIGAPNNC